MFSEKLNKYWKDPVWSKVIGGIILTAGGAIIGTIFIKPEQSPTPAIQTHGNQSPVYIHPNFNVMHKNTIQNITNVKDNNADKMDRILKYQEKLDTWFKQTNNLFLKYQQTPPELRGPIVKELLRLKASVNELTPAMRELSDQLEPGTNKTALEEAVRQAEAISQKLQPIIGNAQTNRVEQTSQAVISEIPSPPPLPQVTQNTAINHSSFDEKIEVNNMPHLEALKELINITKKDKNELPQSMDMKPTDRTIKSHTEQFKDEFKTAKDSNTSKIRQNLDMKPTDRITEPSPEQLTILDKQRITTAPRSLGKELTFDDIEQLQPPSQSSYQGHQQTGNLLRDESAVQRNSQMMNGTGVK